MSEGHVHDAVPRPRPGRPILRPSYLLTGVLQYSPGFVVEVLILFLCLLAFQSLGYTALGLVGRVPDPDRLPLGFLVVTIAMGAGEARFRLYRRVWAVAGLSDALAIVYAIVEATVLITGTNIALGDGHRPFRLLVPVLAAPSAAALIGAFRLLPRLWSRVPAGGNRLLVVVTDSSAYATVKALIQSPSSDWTPIAIVSSQSDQANRTVMGIPVVGNTLDLVHWIQVARADGVAFVMNGNTVGDLQELFGVCLEAELPIFIVPGPDEWLQRSRFARLRQLTADDFVGRDARQIDVELAREEIADRVVMVTGAAGSIGAELSRQIASLMPQRLVLVDNNESGLFDIAEELREACMVDIREILVSIVDRDLLIQVFAQERPEIVFHAAAYKHVPMLESHPEQAVLTNVIGTRNALLCAEAVGARSFVLISTDKAVAKQSIMGCTKRLCELMVLGHTGQTACWAVRFGNVVGSRGSVVPIFERQIEQGGPVTITHPDVTRYMMTIREAASLVLSTLRLAQPRHVYMLDMGQPIKILSLAQSLIRSRGLRPGGDIEIVYTGLRPGERMTEELLGEDEGWRPTSHPDIREVVSPTSRDQEALEWSIPRMAELAVAARGPELIALLKQTVVAGISAAVSQPAFEAVPQPGASDL